MGFFHTLANILRLLFKGRIFSFLASIFHLFVLVSLWILLTFVFQSGLERHTSAAQSFTITAFLETSASSEQVNSAVQAIRAFPKIDSVVVLYPEEAKMLFTERFGAPTDELLPENPFPVTLTIYPRLQPFQYGLEAKVDDIVKNISSVIAIEDVTYQPELLTVYYATFREQLYNIFIILCTICSSYIAARGINRALLRPSVRALSIFQRAKYSSLRLWSLSILFLVLWFSVILGSMYAVMIGVLPSFIAELERNELFIPSISFSEYDFIAIGVVFTAFFLLMSAIFQSLLIVTQERE